VKNDARERGVLCAAGTGQSFLGFLFDYILRTHNTGIVDWTPLPPHPLRAVPAIVVIAHVVESSGGLQTLKTNLLRKKKNKKTAATRTLELTINLPLILAFVNHLFNTDPAP
jgi:hypothetical protein